MSLPAASNHQQRLASDDVLAPRGSSYSIGPEIASGGMATIRLGQLSGPGGFRKLVALKQLHAELAAEPELSGLLAKEARLNSAINHPNVVSVSDVLEHQGELLLVMDYVNGEALAQLLRVARKRDIEVPATVVCRVLSDVLHGLHAAHTATSIEGDPLGIVHRDVSPQNIMVGVDGIARVLDFGVAKGSLGMSYTAPGKVKGKLRYMAPEQVRQRPVDARTDVFAAGIVLWEALGGQPLFAGDSSAQVVSKLLSDPVPCLAGLRSDVSPALDDVIQRALARDPAMRFQNARDFADALEATGTLASRAELGAWVQRMAGRALELRIRSYADLEAKTVKLKPHLAPRSPGVLRLLSRWLRKYGRRSTTFAAAGALLATLAACLLLVEVEGRAAPSPHQAALTHPVLSLGSGPCFTPSSPALQERPAPVAPSASASALAVAPPLRPESLRLEGSPRPRRAPTAHRASPRRARSAVDVLGF